ncbi:MAG: D-alanyl-D-alanine carboxypeptidase family protein, partial [Acutalibacteraceae bacterium]
MKKRLFSIIIFIIIFSVAAVPVPASAFTVSPSYAKNIEAEIYSLVCLTRDNTVLTAKNTGRKVFPGSLTCIMTALVAADNIADLSEEFEVSEDAVAALANSGALGCDLSSGEIMSAENHLYRLLISSAADSATALAFHISDSLEAFTELMNKKAEELGMSNTRFANCTGFY